jgi:hypothetical protein
MRVSVRTHPLANPIKKRFAMRVMEVIERIGYMKLMVIDDMRC